MPLSQTGFHIIWWFLQQSPLLLARLRLKATTCPQNDLWFHISHHFFSHVFLLPSWPLKSSLHQPRSAELAQPMLPVTPVVARFTPLPTGSGRVDLRLLSQATPWSRKSRLVVSTCFNHKIWVRQLGWLFPSYGKINHVPNHQPDSHLHIFGRNTPLQVRLRKSSEKPSEHVRNL